MADKVVNEKDVFVRGFDGDLYDKTETFLKSFGITMTHANKAILKRGYEEILKTKDLTILQG